MFDCVLHTPECGVPYMTKYIYFYVLIIVNIKTLTFWLYAAFVVRSNFAVPFNIVWGLLPSYSVICFSLIFVIDPHNMTLGFA